MIANKLEPAVHADPMQPPAVSWHPLIETTLKEARELLTKALEQEPRLVYWGFYRPNEKIVRAYTNLDAREEALKRDFGRWRAEFHNTIKEVAACADWIKLQKPIASINQRRSSYAYKHLVENWFANRGNSLYVSNGCFIAAAIGLGFKHDGPRESPNVRFNFSEKAMKDVDIEHGGFGVNRRAQC